MELLHFTATMRVSSGQRNLCNAVPHFLGAMGSGTPAMHSRNAAGQWVVECCNAPPHCLGAIRRWNYNIAPP